MPPKTAQSRQIVTRSLAKTSKSISNKESDICTCPSAYIMDEGQKKEFKEIFESFFTKLHTDIEQESHQQRTQLAAMQTELESKSSSHGLRPDKFDGNPIADASSWLDNFQRIAKVNKWTPDVQLNAFPLYLQGIAHAWFLALPAPVSSDLTKLFDAFIERFASGPQEWILIQQLSARKHSKSEPLDDYIADITRLCKRLRLSENEQMRYFIEGLQGDLQAYVSLGRPKTFQEAESLARMKDIVNKRQGVVDTQSILDKMQTMFSKLLDQPSTTKIIAATETGPGIPASDKKIDELSNQIKTLQQQQQQLQQRYLSGNYAMAAYDPPPGNSRPFQARNWQGQPNRQIEQLQRQMARLENDLRRYQNPRRPDFRSYGRSFRSTEGDPICTFCNRVGHTWRLCRQRVRDPRLPQSTNMQPPSSGRSPNRPPHSQLNG